MDLFVLSIGCAPDVGIPMYMTNILANFLSIFALDTSF